MSVAKKRRIIAIDLRMINHSGIGTYLHNLVPRIMAAHPEYKYYLIGPEPELRKPAWVEMPHVQICNFDIPIYSLTEQIAFGYRIPQDYDLFWSPHYNIPLFHQGKLLVTVHDLFHLAMPQLVKGIHRRLYAKIMFTSVSRKARAVICISDFTKKELLRFTGCDESKIRMVPNGVDQSWREAPTGPDPYPKPFFLFVGNIKPHKNLTNLLSAFELIKDQTNHDLVIVGKKEGFITGDATVFARAAQLGSRVFFTGQIDQLTLIQYYKHARALVFPSLYEGFGLPPLEAMVCGCPAIVSHTASLPEVCGEACLYCDPYQPEDIGRKMLFLLNDLNLWDSLRLKGIARAGRFTWEKCAEETWTVIQEVLAD